jgi:hypothetical protein
VGFFFQILGSHFYETEGGGRWICVMMWHTDINTTIICSAAHWRQLVGQPNIHACINLRRPGKLVDPSKASNIKGLFRCAKLWQWIAYLKWKSVVKMCIHCSVCCERRCNSIWWANSAFAVQIYTCKQPLSMVYMYCLPLWVYASTICIFDMCASMRQAFVYDLVSKLTPD